MRAALLVLVAGCTVQAASNDCPMQAEQAGGAWDQSAEIDECGIAPLDFDALRATCTRLDSAIVREPECGTTETFVCPNETDVRLTCFYDLDIIEIRRPDCRTVLYQFPLGHGTPQTFPGGK